MTKLIDYPHLPLLPMDKCFAVFKHAKLSMSMLGRVSGFTRAALYKWTKKQSDPLPHSRDRISVLAYRALRALKEDRAPFSLTVKEGTVRESLSDTAANKPLAQYTPEELLPANWLKQLNSEA